MQAPQFFKLDQKSQSPMVLQIIHITTYLTLQAIQFLSVIIYKSIYSKDLMLSAIDLDKINLIKA